VKLWGGNYSSDPDSEFWEFNRSFPFDRRLLSEEVRASQAWVRALGACRAIKPEEVERLNVALQSILEKADQGASSEAEDVHSFVEERLTELVGELAGQAHIGRSRNEQAVTALRLWMVSAIDHLRDRIGSAVRALVAKGRPASDAIMPGYTHTRAAEPITFGHLASAHAWGLVRDFDRLGDARRRVDTLPLGSGALAGTVLPIDREALARDLGFTGTSENALDAVMDRDFAAEFVFACAQLQTHLSRLAEELIWLSGPEYGFVRLPEAFTTGSSLMPQKKNPDALELVRGKTGRVFGGLVSLLVMMKGLMSGYHKDLQEDKEAIFDSFDTVCGSLAVMTGVLSGLELDRAAMRQSAAQEGLMAAGLAVALAREGIPFRKAHALVGSMVAKAQEAGGSLRESARHYLATQAPALASRLEALFDPEQAVRAKSTRGGTSPESVKESLDAALARIQKG